MKTVVEFFREVEGKIGKLIIDHDAPVAIVKQIIYSILEEVIQFENEALKAHAAMAAQKNEDNKPQEEKDEKTIPPEQVS